MNIVKLQNYRIMKRVKLTNLLRSCSKLTIGLTFISLLGLCVYSCGDDDSDSDGAIVDGTNIRKGKKLVRLETDKYLLFTSGGGIIDTENDYKCKYKIEYDTKGRLTNIWLTNIYYRNGYFDVNVVEIDTLLEVARIDYYFKYITVPFIDSYRHNRGYGTEKYYRINFDLNEKGYISQIANFTCRYNEEGYLTNVDEVKDLWTFTYSNNDVAKVLVERLAWDKITTYYFYYGGDSNAGQLVFNINTTDSHFLSYVENYLKTVVCLIAYEAGLFGKTTKHIQSLSSRNEMSAIIDGKGSDDKENITINCSAFYE